MKELTEAEIERLIERFPLPDDRDDGILGLGDTALALGVSLPTMQRYLKIGLPAIKGGSMGRLWRIRLAAAWAWRQALMAERLERKSRGKQTRSALACRIR
ncbi:hypothetical protein [Rhizobium ruizarguesonis]|uniref:DNA-binding protein n=1 Tax=Rhizobium ruizarguesonis TaxID=2081791 RepID=A0AAE8Q8R8_9HYPH|nr:hypothetical protein [Rhizobium ruizarguesonis]TBD78490.1 hypothetical protein ELH11_00490 [Rhizobium ruizarguesonis]TBE09647.1 hypothetical protein ELH09_00490 [Rhizobium ruizarguesonis]TBF16963.1 hypothetical protein ELG94_00490 [Rhizobium ruizarguesonis]